MEMKRQKKSILIRHRIPYLPILLNNQKPFLKGIKYNPIAYDGLEKLTKGLCFCST